MKHAKTVPLRNRRLLDMARGQPCLMGIHGICNHNPETTVAAHSNLRAHGKARGRKADDCYSVWACSACHAWYDQSNRPQRLKQFIWGVAHETQQDHWRRIAADPLAPAQDKRAAEWALQCLKQKEGILQ